MQIISAIFAILAVVAFLWMVVGNLPGLILLVLALISKNKEQKKKYFRWMKICFGGILMLVIIFVLYFIFSFIGAIIGFPPIPSPINNLPK